MKQLEKVVDVEHVLKILKEEKKVAPDATIKQIPFYKPKVGGLCVDGYSARIGIHEVLPVTHEIRNLILKGSPAEDIETQAKKEGMLTMIEDGIYKAALGITTIDEVLRVVAE